MVIVLFPFKNEAPVARRTFRRIKIDIINFIKSRSAFALMNHLPVAGLVVQGKMVSKHQPWYPPRAAQEAISSAISHHPTRSHSFFVTKPYHYSF
ncbi:MAG TPA: hypothetical protein ENN79_12185 [Desulfobacteraceae bacterium]|nr:hypothetical protein [Desulfobacteraceae bacterium]